MCEILSQGFGMIKPKGSGRIIRESIRNFAADNCLTLGASISFFAMFSFFPLSMLAVSILTTVMGSSQGAMERISNLVSLVTPVGKTFVMEWVRSTAQNRPLAWGVGIVTLIWGARHVFNNIAFSASVIWGRRGWKDVILRQLMALVFVGFFALMLLASIFVPVLVDKLTGQTHYTVGGALILILTFLPYVFSFVTFFTIYFLTSPRNVPRRTVLLGAVAVTVIWEAAKSAFLTYIGMTNITSIYGSIGGIIILMFWVYLSAGILLWGMEFIAASFRAPHEAPHLKRSKGVLVIG
jgi:membrane protein